MKRDFMLCISVFRKHNIANLKSFVFYFVQISLIILYAVPIVRHNKLNDIRY